MDKLGERLIKDRDLVAAMRRDADEMERKVRELRHQADEIERVSELARMQR